VTPARGIAARIASVLAIVITWAAALLGVTAARAADEPPFVVGVGRSIHDSDGVTQTGVASALAWLGVGSVRLDAPWKMIETAPGRYAIPRWLDDAVDTARARGIEPLLILAYGHPLYGNDKPRTREAIEAFSRYAAFVVEHFKGRVGLYDLWNEWDAHTGGTTEGSPDDYVALARVAYPAIKAANRDAVVLSGGISSLGLGQGWVERFVSLDGLSYVDGVSVHPYNFDRAGASTPEAAIATLERVHAALGAAAKPIYVTEMGYPAYTGKGGVSAETAAADVARFVLLASARPYVAGVWWYCLRDQGKDRGNKEHNFGVLDNAFAAKPAGQALRATALLIKETGRFRDESRGADRGVAATRAGGRAVELRWRDDSTDTRLLADLASLVEPAAGPPLAQGRR
jgi:polysaccharide biosynthesis protein PslG